MELFGDFPEYLKPHIANAFTMALRVANLEDIRLLRAPYSELLFGRFYEMSSSNTIECGFHGTSPEVLNSILTFGMLDPTSIKYNVKNGNAYGPGVYISTCPEYSRAYAYSKSDLASGRVVRNDYRISPEPDNIPEGDIVQCESCMLIVLMIKGTNIKSADSIGKTLETDNVQAGNIVVLRSTSQVLPIFACTKLLKRFKVLPTLTMFSQIAGTNTAPSGGKIVSNIIDEMHDKIEFNEEVYLMALSIRQEFLAAVKDVNQNVKIGLIYNLILKFADDKSLADESVKSKVLETLTDYDLS